MTTFDKWDNRTQYKVLKNRHGMYSIWPADRENALGWRDAGKVGPKSDCIRYIEAAFSDLRPTEIAKRMDSAAEQIVRDSR